jgi:4-hydroxythreonine-4-phosphate dehydrogenase
VDTPVQRIAITAGEPAGIGPDLIATLAQHDHACELVVVGNAELLNARARQLGLPLKTLTYDPHKPPAPSIRGRIHVDDVALQTPCIAGVLNPANANYVLATLERAGRGCLSGEFAAVVTAPVQKSVIAESGTPFSGHTEYFAELCGVPLPVMLLCADELRVALLTTHLPLAEVPRNVTHERITRIGILLNAGLQRLFGIESPRIAVLGLNPHAGESGQLGHEERDIIEPAVQGLREQGLNVTGPLPADSAFTRESLTNFDAVLAMYHDQGLPVLKHAGFGHAVNVTLGLPIVRTSVDHGTALSLAGTGAADAGSLSAALQLAENFAGRAVSRELQEQP